MMQLFSDEYYDNFNSSSGHSVQFVGFYSPFRFQIRFWMELHITYGMLHSHNCHHITLKEYVSKRNSGKKKISKLLL